MELYEHQRKIIEEAPDQYLFAFGTGTGKTRTSVELVKVKGGTTLIICPKMLKENWARELKKWNYPPEMATIMSKEEFKRTEFKAYDNIIVDEAHFFANYKSQLGKALGKYIKKYKPRVYLLTATPYMSTPWNIWTLVSYLGISIGWAKFNRICFYMVRMGGRMIPVARKGIEPYLNELIMQVGSVVKMEDCFDVPDQVDEIEYYNLTKDQQEGMKEVEGIFEHIVRFTKQHTLENGLLLGDEYEEDKEFKSDKLERILELSEVHKKLAVVCRYNKQLEMYKKHLKKAGHKVFLINGSVKNRDEVVQQANKSETGITLIQSACSEGYELNTIGLIIFASLDFSYKNYVQMRGRFLRANSLKKNTFVHLLVSGGVDEDVWNCVQNKKDFSFQILSDRTTKDSSISSDHSSGNTRQLSL